MSQAAPDTTRSDLSSQDRHGWRREGRDLMSAIAGGCIVGIPLLYTMEMWFHGMVLPPWHQLGVIAAILIVNFFFCLVSGFRRPSTWRDAVDQAFTSVGIGILLSVVILWLVGAIDMETPLTVISGKVVLEAAAVSLGVSFANAHFSGASRTGNGGNNGNGGGGHGQPPDPVEQAKQRGEDLEHLQLLEDVRDVGATLAGSIIFSLNIAPTEEVVLIATRLDPWRMLALLAATVLLCHVILYASGFEDQPIYVRSIFQSQWAEVALTIGVSWLAGLGLLWMLGEREAFAHVATAVHAGVVLGLPATVGGAAGRLVV